MAHLNLLPDSYRRSMLIRRRLLPWAGIWMLLSGAAALAGWAQLGDFRDNADRLSKLETEVAPLNLMLDDVDTMRDRLQDLRRREELVLRLAEDRSLMTLYGTIGQAVASTDHQVSLSRLSITQTDDMTGDKNGKKETKRTAEPRGTLVLEGIGVDDIAISKFVTALRESGIFRDVHLRSTVPRNVSGKPARSYSLTCVY